MKRMPKLIDVTGAVILRNSTVFAARRGEGKALADRTSPLRTNKD